MKYIIGTVFALMLSGCAITDYMGERKLVLCTGLSQGECPTGMKEAEASGLPYVGDTVGLASKAVLTCVTYTSDNNLTCPDKTKKIVIDLIKE